MWRAALGCLGIGCLSVVMIPLGAATFFFSSWIVMVFWGIVADDVGVRTISYKGAMVVTIGLWLALAPLIASMAKGRHRD